MSRTSDSSDSQDAPTSYESEQRPVWAFIDHDALRHNARRAIEAAAGRTVIGVVKADGYGHGAARVARALLAEGVARLAVVSIAEGAALRREGIAAPILLLGGLTDAAAAARAVKWGLTPVLQSVHEVELAQGFGRPDAPLDVEIELDTGMHRMGVPLDQAKGLLARVLDAPQLTLAGVFTHLARADEPDPAPSRAQCAQLAEQVAAIIEPGDRAPTLHIANSGGLLRLEEFEQGTCTTGAVRPGLMLYGLSPLCDAAGRAVSAASLDLEPVMTLAARVISVRRVAAGEAVGYGGEWTTPRETTLATLPLGYADGIPRSVLGKGTVRLAGADRPIVGRISMDSFVVDVGEAEVAIGDVATVFGRTPEGDRVPVEDFASACGTIGYEVLVGVGARVPRIDGAGNPPAAE